MQLHGLSSEAFYFLKVRATSPNHVNDLLALSPRSLIFSLIVNYSLSIHTMCRVNLLFTLPSPAALSLSLSVVLVSHCWHEVLLDSIKLIPSPHPHFSCGSFYSLFIIDDSLSSASPALRCALADASVVEPLLHRHWVKCTWWWMNQSASLTRAHFFSSLFHRWHFNQ